MCSQQRVSVHFSVHAVCLCVFPQEWRHAYGMRCLGIPNTAHFANITNVADARACELCGASCDFGRLTSQCIPNLFFSLSSCFPLVWEKLRLTKGRERWHADTEEEYEDSVGNVVNKRTYNDLRRQGLL